MVLIFSRNRFCHKEKKKTTRKSDEEIKTHIKENHYEMKQ